MLFFLEDAAVWPENLFIDHAGVLVAYVPTHHNVMWYYMGYMWRDVMWCAWWCDVNALMPNRRQVISKKHANLGSA